MAIVEEVISLRNIICTASPVPGLPIAANVAQRIARLIENSGTSNEDLERLSSTVESVVCSLHQQSSEIIDKCEGKVLPTLTDFINETVCTLELMEDECRNILSQGWLMRKMNYTRDQAVINTMISNMIDVKENMNTRVTLPTLADFKEKQKITKPKSTTPKAPRLTNSSSRTHTSSAGSGIYIINSGNTVINGRFIPGTETHTNRRTSQASSGSSGWTNAAEQPEDLTIIKNGIETRFTNGVKYVNGVRSEDNDNPQMVAEEHRHLAREIRRMAEERVMRKFNSVVRRFERCGSIYR